MTTHSTVQAHPATRSSIKNLLSNWYQREPLIAKHVIIVLTLIPILVFATFIDERTLNGVNIWIKPIKFNIAIVLYLGTLAWYSAWIDRSVMQHRWYRAYVTILCGTLYFMLPWLYGAALIGEAAHYNRTHPILAPMYSAMGIVSVVFTTGTLVLAGLIAFNKVSTLSTYFRHAVVWSLVVSFVFTVTMAGELASMDSHWIGGTPSDKNGLWLFGWSRDGGDLRVAHFFALHALHFIPLAALCVLPKSIAATPKIAAVGLSLLYCAFLVFVYRQAKQGLPFLPWLG